MTSIQNYILNKHKSRQNNPVLNDLGLFCETYFTTDKGIPRKMGAIHHDIYKAIMEARRQGKDIFILGPRQSAKTTYWGISYVIYLLCWQKVMAPQYPIRIITVANNQRKSTENNIEIKGELESNEKLNRDFGPFKTKDDRWSATAFDIQGIKMTRDPHFRATYPKGALGGRGDIIILDDIVDQRNSMSDEVKNDLVNAVRHTITGMKAIDNPHAQMIMFGTDWGPGTIYRKIGANDPAFGNWVFKRYVALRDEHGAPVTGYYEGMEDRADDYTSYWPETWTSKYLINLMRNDEMAFLQLYQSDPGALDGDLFSNFKEAKWATVKALEWLRIGVDPSGTSGTGDLCAVCVAGHNKGTTFILANETIRGDDEAQADLVGRMYSDLAGFRVNEDTGTTVNNPGLIVIEKAGVGQYEMIANRLEARGYPCRGQTTEGMSKPLRIKAMSPFVNTGRIVFITDGQYSEGVQRLILDLRRCKMGRGKKMGLQYIDRVDAMEIAIRQFIQRGEVRAMGEITRRGGL